jgi:hypothetical protein
MSEAGGKPIMPLDLVQGVIEFMLREAVETGRLEINDRTPQEIIVDFDSMLGEFLEKFTSDPSIFRSSIDHRSSLLREANEAAEREHYELAITLYAIWLEHFINGMITRSFERLGYYEDISVPLIKELRLSTKAVVLWKLAKLPDIDQDSLKVINKVVDLRNSFVHYKWQSRDLEAEQQQFEQLQQVTEQAERLIATLLGIESLVFWNGRDKELIAYVHEEIKQKREADQSNS